MHLKLSTRLALLCSDFESEGVTVCSSVGSCLEKWGIIAGEKKSRFKGRFVTSWFRGREECSEKPILWSDLSSALCPSHQPGRWSRLLFTLNLTQAAVPPAMLVCNDRGRAEGSRIRLCLRLLIKSSWLRFFYSFFLMNLFLLSPPHRLLSVPIMPLYNLFINSLEPVQEVGPADWRKQNEWEERLPHSKLIWIKPLICASPSDCSLSHRLPSSALSSNKQMFSYSNPVVSVDVLRNLLSSSSPVPVFLQTPGLRRCEWTRSCRRTPPSPSTCAASSPTEEAGPNSLR